MRRSSTLASIALVLALAACGGPNQGDERSASDLETYEAGEAARGSPPPPPPPPPASGSLSADAQSRAGPNVSPTAAPGVAFNYHYSFGLEAERVAAAQERHASMCERLGTARCRITGMLYRVRGDDDIEARLELKLDPAIAREFGREGVGVVVAAEGRLIESRIAGTDVGTAIRQTGRSIADMEADLRRLEARLAGRLTQGERQSVEYEAQQLRQAIRAAQQNREDAQESLATTPMVFAYGSGDLVPGSDTRRPFRDAMDQAGSNFVDGLAVLFVLIVTLLPWALVGLLGWLGFRALRRQSRKETGAAGPPSGDA